MFSGGCCWGQEYLFNVPSLPWRSSFLRENKTKTAGAQCSTPLQTNRLRCPRGPLQGYCVKRSQAKKVRLHWWVKVRLKIVFLNSIPVQEMPSSYSWFTITSHSYNIPVAPSFSTKLFYDCVVFLIIFLIRVKYWHWLTHQFIIMTKLFLQIVKQVNLTKFPDWEYLWYPGYSLTF